MQQIILIINEEHLANQFSPTFELILTLKFIHECPIELNEDNVINIFYHLIKSICISQIVIFIELLNLQPEKYDLQLHRYI